MIENLEGMDIMTKYIIIALIVYFVLINIITCILYGIDKKKAEKGKWRVPEATLLLFAAIGGSLGALYGMKHYHHKTKKIKFYLGVPVILLLQLALFIFILFKVL